MGLGVTHPETKILSSISNSPKSEDEPTDLRVVRGCGLETMYKFLSPSLVASPLTK